jgi:hydroxyacylglutathione hydrolase
MDMPEDNVSQVAAKKTIQQIYPDIYQIIGQNRSAHAYLIKGRSKNVLIDTCLPDGVESVKDCLSQVGLNADDIDLVLLTHEHIDHAGGVPVFGERALVAAHRLAANKLTLQDEFVLMNNAFGSESEKFHIDLFLAEDTTINLGNYELHVVYTPGHCSGAVCFYEPNHRLLFSGDVVMANGIVGGVLQSGNISDYIHSLRRLAMLKIDHLFPGHGKVSASAESDVQKGIERLETLLEESKVLFKVVQNSQHGFDHIMRSLRDLNR